MIWSWVRRCKIPVEAAKRFGFVAHKYAVSINFKEMAEKHNIDIIERISRKYQYVFEAEVDEATYQCTLSFFHTLAINNHILKPWTVFEWKNANKHAVIFAFSDEDDALKARLSFQ